jgi:hypothetical protein
MCVVLIALFGSTARLMPIATSDVDLLVLVRDGDPSDRRAPTHPRDRLADALRTAQSAPSDTDRCGDQEEKWPFAPAISDPEVSDYDPDFVANVARNGVVPHRHAGVAMAPPLGDLTPWPAWLVRVQRLLAVCAGRVDAAPKSC